MFSLKVWAIADSKRQGYLGLNEFIVAMQVLMFFLVCFAARRNCQHDCADACVNIYVVNLFGAIWT